MLLLLHFGIFVVVITVGIVVMIIFVVVGVTNAIPVGVDYVVQYISYALTHVFDALL